MGIDRIGVALARTPRVERQMPTLALVRPPVIVRVVRAALAVLRTLGMLVGLPRARPQAVAETRGARPPPVAGSEN